MTRLTINAGLLVAAVVLSGCSFGYYVDPAQYPQGSVTAPADRVTRIRATTAAPKTAPRISDPTQTEGTVGGETQTIRGAPDGNLAVAEETARAKATANNAINSICRGC
jgi:hypothetical protein